MNNLDDYISHSEDEICDQNTPGDVDRNNVAKEMLWDQCYFVIVGTGDGKISKLDNDQSNEIRSFNKRLGVNMNAHELNNLCIEIGNGINNGIYILKNTDGTFDAYSSNAPETTGVKGAVKAIIMNTEYFA